MSEAKKNVITKMLEDSDPNLRVYYRRAESSKIEAMLSFHRLEIDSRSECWVIIKDGKQIAQGMLVSEAIRTLQNLIR